MVPLAPSRIVAITRFEFRVVAPRTGTTTQAGTSAFFPAVAVLGIVEIARVEIHIRTSWVVLRCFKERAGVAQNISTRAPAVHSDPEIMSGTPVFVGTRVPFQTLIDYLEAGQPLSEFLEDFPTVSKEQAVAALEQAKDALLDRARPA
jgi:uncharacterized protein (DUF433 family)